MGRRASETNDDDGRRRRRDRISKKPPNNLEMKSPRNIIPSIDTAGHGCRIPRAASLCAVGTAWNDEATLWGPCWLYAGRLAHCHFRGVAVPVSARLQAQHWRHVPNGVLWTAGPYRRHGWSKSLPHPTHCAHNLQVYDDDTAQKLTTVALDLGYRESTRTAAAVAQPEHARVCGRGSLPRVCWMAPPLWQATSLRRCSPATSGASPRPSNSRALLARIYSSAALCCPTACRRVHMHTISACRRVHMPTSTCLHPHACIHMHASDALSWGGCIYPHDVYVHGVV